jgi:hypothetical protein
VNSTETSSNPAATRPARYSPLREGAGDTADVGAALGALLGGQAVLGNDVGDADAAAGP